MMHHVGMEVFHSSCQINKLIQVNHYYLYYQYVKKKNASFNIILSPDLL